MKSFLRTCILLTATLLLFVVPYIPHHHHDGEVCMERVLCVHDYEYNDCHTGHEAEDAHDASNCVKHVIALQVMKSSKVGAGRSPWASKAVHAALCPDRGTLATAEASPIFVMRDASSLQDATDVVRQLRAPPYCL